MRDTKIPTSTPTSVAVRLREQFAPAYLTLTSIIQGVALSTLVLRVEGLFAHFQLANWLLAAATLLAFLLVWHEYLMQALAYVWMPTLVDSAVPFGILVAELFLAHFVYDNERVWFLVAGLAFLLGIVADIIMPLVMSVEFVRQRGHYQRAILRLDCSLDHQHIPGEDPRFHQHWTHHPHQKGRLRLPCHYCAQWEWRRIHACAISPRSARSGKSEWHWPHPRRSWHIGQRHHIRLAKISRPRHAVQLPHFAARLHTTKNKCSIA